MATDTDVLQIIHFRPGPEIGRELQIRSDILLLSRHELAKRDLGRYYDIIKAELRRIRLSEDDWQALLSVMLDTHLDLFVSQTFPEDVAVVLEDSHPELVAKLRQASPAARVAVIDELERRTP